MKIKLPDFYKTFIITITIFSVIFYGLSMNFQAIQSNHGLMPVKTEYTSLDGYSSGDILIIFGFSAFVIYSVVMMHKYHKWRKREKLLEIMRSPSVTYNIQLPKPL